MKIDIHLLQWDIVGKTFSYYSGESCTSLPICYTKYREMGMDKDRQRWGCPQITMKRI